MKMPSRLLAFTTLGLLGLAAPARSQVIIGGPLVPTRTVYMPTTTVVSQPFVARTPIGPSAYVVAPPAPIVVQPRSYITTSTTYLPRTTYLPTTTVVPTRSYVSDPGLVPVGYEVVRPRRTKVVFPRRVVRYAY